MTNTQFRRLAKTADHSAVPSRPGSDHRLPAAGHHAAGLSDPHLGRPWHGSRRAALRLAAVAACTPVAVTALRHEPTAAAAEVTWVEPNASNTGVLDGIALTNYNSPTTSGTVTLVPGSTIENKHIYGDIQHPGGATVTIRNCFLHGSPHTPSSASAVVNCYNTRTAGKIALVDCTIQAQNPTNRDGVAGHNYEAYRCDVSGTVDGFSSLIALPETNVDIVLMGNYVHDLVYYYPDYRNGVSGATWHTDGTHNDCWQHQGGGNAKVQGNSFWGTSKPRAVTQKNPDKPFLLFWNNGLGAARTPGWSNGACILIQQNDGLAPVNTTVVVENNFLHGGLAHLNANDSDAVFQYRNNVHYRNTAFNEAGSPTWKGAWIRIANKARANMPGLTDTNTNRWADGPYAGKILTEPRDLGVLYDS